MTYIPLAPIAYAEMSIFQKETFNFHKLAARLMELMLAHTNVGMTSSWRDKGIYHWPQLSGWAVEILEPYKINKVGK